MREFIKRSARYSALIQNGHDERGITEEKSTLPVVEENIVRSYFC